MLKLSSLAIVMLLILAAPAPADIVTLQVWKAALSLALQAPGPSGSVVKRTLGNNDVINLALGRPLTTKPDKKTEIVALAGDSTTPGPESQIVVFNPVTKTIVTTIWTFNNFILLNNPDFSVDFVATDASFVATTLGTPAQDGFLASSIAVAGSGKFGSTGGLSASATSLSGPINFRVDGTLVNGIILKGKLKISGGILAVLP